MQRIDATPDQPDIIEGKGYVGYSKSINATNASERGAYNASEIVKLIKKGITSYFISANFFTNEWHHCSSYYNKVAYYSLSVIKEWLDTSDGKEALKRHKAASKQAKEEAVYLNQKINWILWTGGRKNPIRNELSTVSDLIKKGKKCTFTYNGVVITKMEGTNGFCFKPNLSEEERKAKYDAKKANKLAKKNKSAWDKHKEVIGKQDKNIPIEILNVLKNETK